MWRQEICLVIEFAIFDQADSFQIMDERGWLYGVLRDNEGELVMLGTWDEQAAEFQPGPTDDAPWHGYPQPWINLDLQSDVGSHVVQTKWSSTEC